LFCILGIFNRAESSCGPAIVNNHATVGGPQPAELDRMLKIANQKLVEQNSWIEKKRVKINASLAKLDADFGKLLKSGK